MAKTKRELDREIKEILEAQAARSGLSKHHRYLLSQRKPSGALGAGYLTPAGWHGDPLTIEDPKLRLAALREQPAPRFPRVSHATKATQDQSLPIDEIARGMLRRYSSAKVAMEMAHWHAMDHAEGSALRTRWLRVREMIERLSKSRAHSSIAKEHTSSSAPSLRVGQQFDHFGHIYEITKIWRDKNRTVQIARRHRDPFGKEAFIDHRSFPARHFDQQHLKLIT